MTPTEHFIGKGLEGGWRPSHTKCGFTYQDGFVRNEREIEGILLDADLWRCAGKALGWQSLGYADIRYELPGDVTSGKKNVEEWQIRQHGLLDALASGQTADDYLAGLLTDANPAE